MIHGLGQEGFWKAHAPYYEKIQSDSMKPFYSRCTTFTWLSMVLALVNLKAGFGWSDKSFTELLVLLKNMLLEDNILPKNHYGVKKILCLVGMEYQKIHACPVMIVFCTKINLPKCASAQHMGYHVTN